MTAAPLAADPIKIATWNVELSRKGPGLLLRDILRGEDPQIAAIAEQLIAVDADIVALQGFDYDLTGMALTAFADLLKADGFAYPYRLALPTNAGLATPLDLDGDGKRGGPGDAQGYAPFYGSGAMAILSRYPIATQEVIDFTPFLWRDLPDALLPFTDAGPFPSAEALAVQRLPTHGHWVVPIDLPQGNRLTLLTFHASPPVFDGPEDRNGKRNHDEVLFWHHFLEGTFGPAPEDRFVILGDANLDPRGGDGRGIAMQRLLANPLLQDPLPDLPTVSFSQTGPMRVDYILPSVDLRVMDAGVAGALDAGPSRHALVWVTLAM